MYTGGLDLDEAAVESVVARTDGGSAALIKELMRRAAQFLLESGEQRIGTAHFDAALEEMLFAGGSLNAALLGGRKLTPAPRA